MNNFGLVLLSTLIPIAILVLESNKETWGTILDKVIQVKRLAIDIGAMFLPSALFSFFYVDLSSKTPSIFPMGLLCLSLFSFALGAFDFITVILVGCYKWIKNPKSELNGSVVSYQSLINEEYLKQSMDYTTQLEEWGKIWGTEKTSNMSIDYDSEKEQRLIEIFISHASDHIGKKQYKQASALLNIYLANIGNRESRNVIKLYDIVFEAWVNLPSPRSEDNFLDCYALEDKLSEIIGIMTKRALEQEDWQSAFLFKSIEKAVMNSSDSNARVEKLFSIVLPILFDHSDSQGFGSIWLYFPGNWRINSTTLENNRFSWNVHNNFQQYFYNQITSSNQKDNQLRKLFAELFKRDSSNFNYSIDPDPFVLSMLYSIFMFRNALELLINYDGLFMPVSAVVSSTKLERQEIQKSYENNAYQLISKFFEGVDTQLVLGKLEALKTHNSNPKAVDKIEVFIKYLNRYLAYKPIVEN